VEEEEDCVEELGGSKERRKRNVQSSRVSGRGERDRGWSKQHN
jgi:hypothetical protein